MKIFSIILTIGTVILLVLNFLIIENSGLKSSDQLLSQNRAIVVEKNEMTLASKNSQDELKVNSIEKPDIFSIKKNMEEEKPPVSQKISEDVKIQAEEKLKTPETGKKLINLDISDIRIILSGILLLGSMGIILFGKNDESLKKWAFGIIGSLMGFWLR